MSAVECQVTDGRGRPDVVHSPNHGFAGLQNLTDALQRQHALVHPVQVDDVSLLELRQLGDVRAAIGNVDLEEMLAAQVQACPDNKTFPEEVPPAGTLSAQGTDRQTVALLVAYQHLRLGTVVVQRLHQPARCHGSTPRPLARIDNQYPHL